MTDMLKKFLTMILGRRVSYGGNENKVKRFINGIYPDAKNVVVELDETNDVYEIRILK